MSITPEERTSWRKRLSSPFSCADAEHANFTLRLLDALETTESENKRLRRQKITPNDVDCKGCPERRYQEADRDQRSNRG